MSRKRGISVKVFDAISAPLRLQILGLIYTRGALGYSEIMSQLKLNPSRDAGKFAYHLRKLLQAKLINADKKTKKYRLSPLGDMVIGFSQSVEEHALLGGGKLFVRTSRLAMEEFDGNKIVQALNREAGVPIDLAQKIAEETEGRLLKLDTLYLTAPLIREFVNAILVEKGLQEYRHKLTRLGLPVYDVTQLIKKAEKSSFDLEGVSDLMGRNVMVEYVLLNVLPRKVADAHLSGLLHMSDADMWVLKPNQFHHDLRVFMRRGFRPSKAILTAMALAPPKTFEAALALALSVVENSSRELIGEQVINHFNVLLSPFVRNLSPDDVGKALKCFLFNLSQVTSRVSLGIDFRVPEVLESTRVTRAGGEVDERYGDYFDENLKILDALLDLIFEDADHKPVLNPHLVFNISPRDLNDVEVEAFTLGAHKLAAKRGTPFFVNLLPSWQKGVAYSATGNRLSSDWMGDWELDTERTGDLGSVVMNLPRLAYEARGRRSQFFESLNDCVNMAVNALKIKCSAIEDRMSGLLLPFLSHEVAEEPYFRMRSAPLLVGFVGLNEATKIMVGVQPHEERRAVDFAIRLVTQIASQAKELSKRSGFRIAASQSIDSEAAQRLAKLDVEKYGWGTAFTQGTREAPYYTDLTAVPLEAEVSLKDRLQIESAFHPLLTGGHLTPIELGALEVDPELLLDMTREICQSYSIGAYAFTRNYGYCQNCRQIFNGQLQKCPKCKSMKGFVRYSRLSSSYLPLDLWPKAKREAINKRVHYSTLTP